MFLACVRSTLIAFLMSVCVCVCVCVQFSLLLNNPIPVCLENIEKKKIKQPSDGIVLRNVHEKKT